MQIGGSLGALIVAAIEKRGITAGQLAREAGLSSSGIYKIIKGEGSMPKQESLRRIAKAGRIPLDDLWNAAQEDFRPSEPAAASSEEWVTWLREITLMAEDLAPEDQQLLRELLGDVADAYSRRRTGK